MLQNLPPEILITIFSNLDLPSITALTTTCKAFHDLCRNESIWANLSYRQFNVDLKVTATFSPRLFYRTLLYPYRKAVGVWQRKNLKHYGSILKVTPKSDGIHLQELVAPTKIFGDFKVFDFVKIGYDENSDKVVFENRSRFPKGGRACVKVNGVAGLSVIFPELEESSANPSEWRQNITEFIETTYGKGTQLTDLGLHRFIETLQANSFHRYEKLEPPLPNTQNLPITQGYFFGTYGDHGIEVVQVKSFHLSPQTSSAISDIGGLKITGDPNIAAGQITFRIIDDKCLNLTLQDQESMAQVEKFDKTPRYVDYFDGLELDFRVPEDCHEREKLDFQKCRGRWRCEGQIAQHGGYDARFIPAHFILFDEDYFSVLFIELGSIVLYRRITDLLF
eukprot:TRINITY_DN3532_c1_g1_i3.p1 TRINITY_DN3532_c1_g1~~TRINITY_DN3532_c1_g1_i3.p1  ORF type:complete len:393 (+),score=73.22 TRINITY_DN3532_c1_g1_i3:464-1642(+)